MTNLNNRLQSALSTDDEAFLRDLEDGRGMFTQMKAAFVGPMAPMSYIAMVFVIAFSALMIWSGLKAFHATTDRETVLWSAGFISSLIPHGLLRLWFLNRTNHLMLLRELKKIELRVARLSESPV